jgi:hypothetical protein
MARTTAINITDVLRTPLMSDVLWHPKAKRVQLENAGDIGHGGAKFVVHSGETTSVQVLLDTVRAKNAAPHFILGLSRGGGRELIQCIALDKAARALKHTLGPETNRANAIQVEVAEFAKNAQKWDRDLYRFLHLLMLWCHRHGGVPMEAHHPFIGQSGYHRLSGTGWVHASGLVGHCHCPGNDHIDPGNLKTGLVLGT